MTTTAILYIIVALLGVCCLGVFAWILLALLKDARKGAQVVELRMPTPPAPPAPPAPGVTELERHVVHEHRIVLEDDKGNAIDPTALFAMLAAAQPQVVAPAPVAAPAPAPVAPAPVVEEAAEEAEEDADEAVVFDAERKSLTLDEKYEELTDEQKALYDAVVAKASGIEGAKRFKNARYEEYKCGKMRLVRLQIKRGVIICEFILYNDDFKAYISENKLKIKPAPTVIRLIDEASLQIALDSIDMVVDDVEAEKEHKKQVARERRRQSRAEAKD